MIKAEVQMDGLDKRPVIAAAPGGGRTKGRLSLGPKPPPLGKPPLTYTLKPIFHQKTGWRRVKFASPNA